MTANAPTDEFAGKVAVVTGAASGIGTAVARALELRGARVAGFDLAAAPLDAVDLAIGVDVSDPDAVQRAVKRVADELGPPTLGVHSAGITRDGVLWKLAPEDFDAVLRVNLSGGFHLLRSLTPHIRAEGGGSVVLISSINGTRGKFGQSAYTASKAGLHGLAKTAARELGRFGGRVNVIAPGMVETPMTAGLAPEWRQRAVDETALGRIAAPADVAEPVVFLLSTAARHVTGQVLHVDGGQCMT